MTTTRTLETRLESGMPEEVRALGYPWPSLVGRVRGLTPELEKDFRFGQSVIRLRRGYRIGGNLKGGTSTMWYPASRQDFKAYAKWRKREALPGGKNHRAFRALLALLDSHGLVLRGGNGGETGQEVGRVLARRGWVFEAMHAILSRLPRVILANPEFAGLQIGGWGPDASKGSAYDRGWVLLYDFALDGARRSFLGLLLHELGHAHEHAMTPLDRDRLLAAYAVLCAAGAFLGVEFLLDGETRRILQQFAFGEFLAETFMVYVSQGGRLRDYIGSLEGDVGDSWRVVYDVYRETFEGVEYA